MIKVEQPTKEYKRAIRDDGVLDGLRTLFKPSYESILAVNNILFRIDEGELVGYIGPNGAGKSTSIKLLCATLNLIMACISFWTGSAPAWQLN